MLCIDFLAKNNIVVAALLNARIDDILVTTVA